MAGDWKVGSDPVADYLKNKDPDEYKTKARRMVKEGMEE